MIRGLQPRPGETLKEVEELHAPCESTITQLRKTVFELEARLDKKEAELAGVLRVACCVLCVVYWVLCITCRS